VVIFWLVLAAGLFGFCAGGVVGFLLSGALRDLLERVPTWPPPGVVVELEDVDDGPPLPDEPLLPH